MLHDDSLCDDIARVITDICLVQRVLNLDPGRGEVSEVHYRPDVEVAIKVAGIVPARQSEQLRDLAGNGARRRSPSQSAAPGRASHRDRR